MTETLNTQKVTEVGAGGKLNTAENNQGNVQWSKTKYNTQKTTNYQKLTTKTGSRRGNWENLKLDMGERHLSEAKRKLINWYQHQIQVSTKC